MQRLLIEFSGSVVDMIFLNFLKAFDVVNHPIILIKLQMLRVGGQILLWICDFLIDRTTCVRVAGQTSDPKAVASGVPQSSMLSPVLFPIYVIVLLFLWNVFADDFRLYLSFPIDSCI